MSRIHAALLGGAMGLTSMSCVNRESPPLDHEGTVASHEEPLSGQGMEALIPLRLVNVLPCAPGPSCPDNADYHSVLRLPVPGLNFPILARRQPFTPVSFSLLQ